MKNSYFYNAPSRRETRFGWIYYAISFIALPYALRWFSSILAVPLTDAKLNFLYYCINFTAVLWIFRRFLGESFRAGVRRPFSVLWYAALGYLGAEALGEMLTYVLFSFLPGYSNLNDASIATMMRAEPLLAVAVVLLVPVESFLFSSFLEPQAAITPMHSASASARARIFIIFFMFVSY